MKSEKLERKVTIKQKILDVIRKSEKIRVSFLLSHSLIWYIVFLIVPLSVIFVYSFWQMIDVHLIPNWTLENYAKFITYGLFNAPWLGVLLGFAASLIVITIIFYITDRTMVRKKQALLNDAFVISFVGALVGTIFTLTLPWFGVGAILSLIVWLLLIRRYYETNWLKSFAFAILAAIMYAAISFISAPPLIPSSLPLYPGLLIKSIFMSVAVTLGSVGIGYPVAYYLSMKVQKYKYTLLFLLMGPYLASYILLVFAWKVILDYGTKEGGGVINFVLLNLGLIEEPITWFMYNMGTVVFILIFSWGPWLVFPMFANLEKMDKTLLEAAADLGANPRQTFLKVTLPLSMPGILVAVLLVFIPTIGEFVTPSIVGGTEGTMYANFIERMFKRGWDWPLGSALSFILLITTLIMVSILLRKVSLEQVTESL